MDIEQRFKDALGDQADDFKEEAEKYGKWFESVAKDIAKGGPKLRKDRLRDLKHLEKQIGTKGQFVKAKAKSKGYNAFRGILQLCVELLIETIA
jgi:hypothetical protein